MHFDEKLCDEVVRARFGFEGFRPGQKEALKILFEQGGLLCIQPTGYGKSLLYQLPASLLEGITLVISPLLALMRDQIGQLSNRFFIPSACINSDQTMEENDEARARAEAGDLKILFVAPEQLDNIERAEFLWNLPIDLVVVDEAHCISTWGHDFRPSYREIAHTVRALRLRRPHMLVLGLTATADERCEQDISAQLAPSKGEHLEVVRRSMDRANIALHRGVYRGMAAKLVALDMLVKGLDGPGLIYCATRDHTQIVSDFLTERGHHVPAYHAGLAPEQKRALQDAFLGGDYTAISATNALGMGIDKSDLRFVLHVDVPGSMTAYYQEVGRAGRDGLPAQGVLLFAPEDRKIQEYFIDSARPLVEDFAAVLAYTKSCGVDNPPKLNEIKMHTGLHPTRVTVVVAELVEQGQLVKVKHKGSQGYRHEGKEARPNLVRYARQEIVRTGELNRMMSYGQGEVQCLMQALRSSLGDVDAPLCGRCSQCTKETLCAQPQEQDVARVQQWLLERPVVVSGSRRPAFEQGLALYDGTLKTREYASFMRGRTGPFDDLEEVSSRRLLRTLDQLSKAHKFDGVVVLPSQTWAQRASASRMIAAHLGVPLLAEAVTWCKHPEARQGELWNNDQRRANVHGLMMSSLDDVPTDAKKLLVFDDYTGSGATLKEAVRVLRKEALFKGMIVPLVMARVRWKLGRTGMV